MKTVAAVAQRWDCQPDYVRELIRRGQLPAIDISASQRPNYRIADADIDRFEEQRRTPKAA